MPSLERILQIQVCIEQEKHRLVGPLTGRNLNMSPLVVSDSRTRKGTERWQHPSHGKGGNLTGSAGCKTERDEGPLRAAARRPYATGDRGYTRRGPPGREPDQAGK